MSYWHKTNLAEAPVQIIDGDRGKAYPKHSDFLDEGFCVFLDASNVTSEGFNFKKVNYISEDKDIALRKGRLERYDVVLTTRGTIGNVAYYNERVPFEHLRINSGMVVLRCDREGLLPDYLYHFLRSQAFKDQVNSLRSGVAQPQLPIKDLRLIALRLPSLLDQGRISTILSAYDDLIENNLRRIQLLEDSARLLYQEWFVRLRFPGHEHVKIVDGVPEGWEPKKMHDVCESIGGGTPSTSRPEYWEGGSITWVTPSDITRNNCLALLDSEKKITEAGLKNSSAKMLPPETILMTSRASLGFFGLLDREVCTNQGFIAVVPNEEHIRMYLLHNLMSRKEEIIGKAGGTTYKEINKSTFRELNIVIPSYPLLVEFSEFARDALRQVRLLKKQETKLHAARDLLLPRLMDGTINV